MYFCPIKSAVAEKRGNGGRITCRSVGTRVSVFASLNARANVGIGGSHGGDLVKGMRDDIQAGFGDALLGLLRRLLGAGAHFFNLVGVQVGIAHVLDGDVLRFVRRDAGMGSG